MADSPVAADLHFIREVNTAAILDRLREQEPMSVAELAAATGLSRQAVTRALTGLQDLGLVELLAPDRSDRRSGRPAQRVRFRAEAGYVVGALIDPQQIRFALADLQGSIVASTCRALGPHTSGSEAVAQLGTEVNALLRDSGITTDEVYAAAIGAPGIIDPEEGVIRLVPSMSGLRGDIVVRTLSERLNCPVYLDNDVKFAAKGEQWRGVRRDDESLVVIHWGERIGAGIRWDGKLYRGATNAAGDLGFLDLIVDPSEQAPVPGLGPFEAWAGTTALVHLADAELARYGQEERRQELTGSSEGAADRVLTAVKNGDPWCTTALRDLADRFSVGLAAICIILDPHLVVLSGPITRAGESLLQMIRDGLARHPFPLPELAISSLGRDAVVHGAIRHSLDGLERTRYEAIEKRRSAHAGAREPTGTDDDAHPALPPVS